MTGGLPKEALVKGAKIGMWTLAADPDFNQPVHTGLVACQCDCGTQKGVSIRSLRAGVSKSCGCARMSKMLSAAKKACTTHGMSKSGGEYDIWCSMRQRCSNPNRKEWPMYGGRGIRVCERWWNSFSDFYSDMGPRPKGHSIDRIDCNGNYEPSNCRWSTNKVQSFNRTNTINVTLRGNVVSLKEACAITGQKYTTVRARYMRGIPLNELFPE